MNVKNREKKFLRYLTLIMAVMMAVSAIIPVNAEETAVPETQQQTNVGIQIKYEDLIDEKIESEPYNKTNTGLFFGKYGENKKADYCFFVRVEEDKLSELYKDYASFEKVAVIEFLYREKGAFEGEAEGWKAGNAGIVSMSKSTDEANGKEYVYFILDTYDGGMKDLEAGKDYQIILEFLEKLHDKISFFIILYVFYLL